MNDIVWNKEFQNERMLSTTYDIYYLYGNLHIIASG